MSHPPDYPGRQRLKRAASKAGGEAYQGAFEAVGAVLFACAVGYWIDGRWDTSPYGLSIGAVIGFAAMVLRLVRLGKELHPELDAGITSEVELDRHEDAGSGPGLTPGMSDVLRADPPPSAGTSAPEIDREDSGESRND